MNVGLAPMEGISDFPTRLWFALTSAPSETTTPFLRVTKDFPYKRVSRSFTPELTFLKGQVGYKLYPQLMASSTDDFLRLANEFLRFSEFVEVNCGCPAPVVVGNGAGSGLLEKQDRFRNFIETLSKELGSNLAVKMRTGFASDEEFEGLLRCFDGLTLAKLTVHGRTRADRYTGKARWKLIDTASNVLPFPVYGSGDIGDAESYKERVKEASKCAGAIVGRGALRNPWLFEELRTCCRTVICYDVLELSLTAFALIQDLSFTKPETLFGLVEEGLFLTPRLADKVAWKDVTERLIVALHSRNVAFEDLEIQRGSIAKLKMLWNYCRSAHPAPFFSGIPFRAQSFGDFIKALREIKKQIPGDSWDVCYFPQNDWLYAGEKEKHATTG